MLTPRLSRSGPRSRAPDTLNKHPLARKVNTRAYKLGATRADEFCVLALESLSVNRNVAVLLTRDALLVVFRSVRAFVGRAEVAEHGQQVLAAGQRAIDHGDELLDFDGQLQLGAEDQQRFVGGLGSSASLELAEEHRVRLGEKLMEVAQDEQALLRQAGHRIEHGHRVLLVAGDGAGTHVEAAGADRPGVELVAKLPGHAGEHGLGAAPLVGKQEQAGRPGADVVAYCVYGA